MNMVQSTVVEDDRVTWISSLWKGAGDYRGQSDEVLFVSFPFDHCVSHRPGARHGPEAILNALSSYSAYCTDRRTDIGLLSWVREDPLPADNDIQAYFAAAQAKIAGLPEAGSLICLGGDHSVGDAIYRGQVERLGKKVGLIQIDAHFDCRAPVKGREHSGHWIYTLADILDYRCLAQIGVNASIYAGHYVEQAERSGVLVKTVSETRRHGSEATMALAIEHVLRDSDCFHVSMDIDVIDQAFCPGTSVPNPAGLFPIEVCDMLFLASRHSRFVGCDIMEVSPPLDTDERTSHVAAQIILHTMSGLALRSSAGLAAVA